MRKVRLVFASVTSSVPLSLLLEACVTVLPSLSLRSTPASDPFSEMTPSLLAAAHLTWVREDSNLTKLAHTKNERSTYLVNRPRGVCIFKRAFWVTQMISALLTTSLKGPFIPRVSANSTFEPTESPLGRVVPSKGGGGRIFPGLTSEVFNNQRGTSTSELPAQGPHSLGSVRH